MKTPYQRALDRFKGKKVLIFGLGLLGGAVGDSRFFASIGAKVRVTDRKSESELHESIKLLKQYDIEFSLGKENPEDISWADVIVRNPSVSQDHPLLAMANQSGKEIVMRTSLFVELANCETIGITGTRGKTTTTQMIYTLAKHFSTKNVLLGGNISGSSDLELLSGIKNSEDTLAVLELSSWQLQGFKASKISPNISVLTNLYPDHLNVYPDLDTYFSDKKTIIDFQKKDDYTVINHEQFEFGVWSKRAHSHIIEYSKSDLPSICKLRIPGDHNRSNAAAALAVATVKKWPIAESLKILQNFEGVPYRLQTIAIHRDIEYINDTTATTPVATCIALDAVRTSPILICGGNDKNLPIQDFADKLSTHTKNIILLPGSGTERLKSLLAGGIIFDEAKTMNEAVRIAKKYATEGDIILLSPGFTSFGLFNNEFDRGDQFNRCVRDLEKN